MSMFDRMIEVLGLLCEADNRLIEARELAPGDKRVQWEIQNAQFKIADALALINSILARGES
jgi:hypothetical protein